MYPLDKPASAAEKALNWSLNYTVPREWTVEIAELYIRGLSDGIRANLHCGRLTAVLHLVNQIIMTATELPHKKLMAIQRGIRQYCLDILAQCYSEGGCPERATLIIDEYLSNYEPPDLFGPSRFARRRVSNLLVSNVEGSRLYYELSKAREFAGGSVQQKLNAAITEAYWLIMKGQEKKAFDIIIMFYEEYFDNYNVYLSLNNRVFLPEFISYAGLLTGNEDRAAEAYEVLLSGQQWQDGASPVEPFPNYWSINVFPWIGDSSLSKDVTKLLNSRGRKVFAADELRKLDGAVKALMSN